MKRRLFLTALLTLSGAMYSKPASNMGGGRSSSDPYISGDSFRAIADHVYDETDRSLRPDEVKERDIIFVKTDLLKNFFTTLHPRISRRYILVTHNSDYGAPAEFASYLDDEKIIVWFGQNPTLKGHSKFHPIPIGIANRCWPHGTVAHFDEAIRNKNSYGKNYFIGLNFKIGTYFAERNRAFNYFSKRTSSHDISSPNHKQYLINMAQTHFTISPRGNGLDCHRTWEALLVGSIPVVTSSPLDPIFEELPVIVVNAWEEVTEQFLHSKLQEIQTHEYRHEKVYFQYWANLITSYKKSAK